MSIQSDFVTLARLSTNGRRQDVVAFLRRVAAKGGKGNLKTSAAILDLLENEESSPMRISGALPVDLDSRHELLRVVPPSRCIEPILSEANSRIVEQVIEERKNIDKLNEAGLDPSRSILLTGPPGLGKTMTAKWLSSQLAQPLMVLDLSSVMSSLLGKTGGNLRAVIDFAKQQDGILLLDEFDSVAKRRDDAVEIGELKRLVTVLLQEIDLWPPDKMLIAATNHEELLDPAIWRRFDVHLRFKPPSHSDLSIAVTRYLSFCPDAEQYAGIVAAAFSGRSFCDVERHLTLIRKQSLLTGKSFVELLQESVRGLCKSLPIPERKQIAMRIFRNEGTKSAAHEWTGVSRDTIRSALKSDGEDRSG